MISKNDIKQLSRLSTKKGRNEYGLYLIEGLRIIRSALRVQTQINRIFVTAKFEESVDYQLISNRLNQILKPEIIDEKTMKQITQTVTPSGVLAVCSLPKITELPSTIASNWLYLDKIADPGNLGTLLRSAAWFGTTQVALSPHCADLFNPKVMRGGMGAHFSLQMVTNCDLRQFKSSDHLIIGADHRGMSIVDFNHNAKDWVLVIGSEAHGISKENSNHIKYSLSIPANGSGNSLNAAVAGSIMLYCLNNL
jgi:TrmH family RNA methyltransferase|tara:strand:- start:81 stop:836 length:756 start_codon:yes stop_codon:yes gene_type:complete